MESGTDRQPTNSRKGDRGCSAARCGKLPQDGNGAKVPEDKFTFELRREEGELKVALRIVAASETLASVDPKSTCFLNEGSEVMTAAFANVRGSHIVIVRP